MAQSITDLPSALDWATHRCARRESCRSEIAQHLQRHSLPTSTIDEVLATLEKEGYIDHARYAQAFVHDKLAYDRWGRLKIAHALRLKGIERSHIEAAFSEELNEATYRATLAGLLREKLRSLRFDPNDRKATYQASQKLLRFAASRGFEAEYVFDEIDHLDLHD